MVFTDNLCDRNSTATLFSDPLSKKLTDVLKCDPFIKFIYETCGGYTDYRPTCLLDPGFLCGGVDYHINSTCDTAVPEPSTYVAGALLLLPFGMSTIRSLRKNKAA